MFTGIVIIGEVLAISKNNNQAKLRIKADAFNDYQHGESIAINGICLTVTDFAADWFEVFASTETLKSTNLGKLAKGKKVNLERALILQDRLGGHFVSGHIDTMAKLQTIKKSGDSNILRFNFDPKFWNLVVPKGSITLDGISLTINKCGSNFLEVNIIPATFSNTTIATWRPGYIANMETDMLGKYVLKNLDTAVKPRYDDIG